MFTGNNANFRSREQVSLLAHKISGWIKSYLFYALVEQIYIVIKCFQLYI